METTLTFHSPVGFLLVTEANEKLIGLSFLKEARKNPEATTPLLAETGRQLQAYFDGKLQAFDLPLETKATAFQQKVLDLLLEIPYGKTLTYTTMARKYGDEKAIRAVAAAIGKNPIPILIPCHRVIGSDGSLTGFIGGLAAKAFLLALENPNRQQEIAFG